MKIIVIFAVLTFFIVNTPQAHAMFNHVAAEKDRRQHAEQNLDQVQHQLGQQRQLAQDQQRLINEQQNVAVDERRRTSRWQTTAFVLGISTVVMLIIGTAIGSKGRHHAAGGK